MKRHLTRGKLTLDLIEKISIDENPDFARVSALWLPVQTYYAVNGFGLAVLAARKGPGALPQGHRAFLSEAASNLVQSLFPKPYSAMLKAGYRGFRYLQPEFVNIRDVRTPIRSGFNLESPDPITGDAHIAQCLDTTRRNEVERRLDDVRKRERKPGKKYRVLSGARQKQLVQKIGPTSILDYLYRVRIKSNYEDVTMYQEGDDDSHIVLELVESTQMLAENLCTLLLAVLWRLIDKSNRKKLRADVELDELVEQIQCV